MGNSVSKINLGQFSGKKSTFTGTSVYNGTLTFGQVIPTWFSGMLIPQSKIKINLNQFVRLGSMPSITFGKVSLRNYIRAIEIAEIWKPFEAFLSKQLYNQNGTSYQPTSLPYIRSAQLLSELAFYSYWSVYKIDATSVISASSSSLEYKDVTYVDSQLPNNLRSALDSALVSSINVGNMQYLFANNQRYTTDDRIAIETADFVLEADNGGDHYIFAFRFGRQAKVLKKIFDGLGYTCTPSSLTQCVLPLFAYFKAWFETFAPKTIGTMPNTWDGTNAVTCLNYLASTAIYDCSSSTTFCQNFHLFIRDLSYVCYFSDPDFVTSHISMPNYSAPMPSLYVGDVAQLGMNTTTSVGGQQVSSSTALAVSSGDYLVNSSNTTPWMTGADSTHQTKFAHDLLIKATRWMNANTFIGGKIDTYLKKYYGADYVQKVSCPLLGSCECEIKIFDVDATANNTDTEVGVPQGKGIGGMQNKDFTYTSRSFAYVFVLSVVVPRAHFCQMGDLTNTCLNAEEVYMPLYDSLGYTLTQKSHINNQQNVFCKNMADIDYSDAIGYIPFGFKPRYFEYKTSLFRDTISGDFRNKSTALGGLESMWLGKYLNPVSMLHKDYDSGSKKYDEFSINCNVTDLPKANSAYGSVGAYYWLGEFNRIFTDRLQSGEYDWASQNPQTFSFNENNAIVPQDNFILQQEAEITLHAPMKPICNSWDVEQSEDDTMNSKIY